MTTFTPILAGIFGLGTPEIIGILAIMLLLFGGTKLPGLARGLGQSVKEFKKAAREDSDDEAKPADVKKPADAAKTHGSN